jgi:1-acyl-sn-glycerol-3-phosphate acyltransferase
MPVPHVLIRRLLVAPLILLAEALIVVASPLLAVIAAIACAFAGDLRPLRVLAITLSYCARHIACTLGCLGLWLASGFGRTAQSPRMQHRYYGLMRWFVGGVSHTVLRMARVEVVHTGSEAAEAVLAAGDGPVVVLSRHAGEGDTLLVLHQLLCAHGRRPRVVLHELLRLDPLIDVFGHRLPNRFVDPRGGDTEVEIAAMAQDAGALDAVLIFPEGGNFSPERRRRGIERLAEAGHDEEAAWAREMEHVSAPRPGGALAALEAAPHAGVVFLGYVGVPFGARELWRSLARPQRVELRLWHVPADDIPAGRDERIDWLFGWWRTLDTWIGERAGAQPTS